MALAMTDELESLEPLPLVINPPVSVSAGPPPVILATPAVKPCKRRGRTEHILAKKRCPLRRPKDPSLRSGPPVKPTNIAPRKPTTTIASYSSLDDHDSALHHRASTVSMFEPVLASHTSSVLAPSLTQASQGQVPNHNVSTASMFEPASISSRRRDTDSYKIPKLSRNKLLTPTSKDVFSAQHFTAAILASIEARGQLPPIEGSSRAEAAFLDCIQRISTPVNSPAAQPVPSLQVDSTESDVPPHRSEARISRACHRSPIRQLRGHSRSPPLCNRGRSRSRSPLNRTALDPEWRAVFAGLRIYRSFFNFLRIQLLNHKFVQQ